MIALLIAASLAAERQWPEPLDPSPFTLPEAQVEHLSNGLKVLLAESNEVPLYEVRLVFNQGTAADPSGLENLSSVAHAMLLKGSKTLTAAQISAKQKRLGANLSSGAAPDGAWVSVTGIKRTLPESVALMAEVALQPAWDADEWTIMQQQRLAGLVSARKNPNQIALRALRQLVWGDTYTGRLANEAAYEALTPEHMADWYASRFTPENAMVLVAGDVGWDDVQPVLEEQFGSWTGQAKAAPAGAPTPRTDTAGKLYLVDNPGASQSVLRLNLLAPDRLDDDHYPLKLAATAFGGMFTSRVNMLMREEKGYTYGARCNVSHRRGPGLFICSSSVRSDATLEAVDDLKGLLRSAAGEEQPLTDEELARFRQTEIYAFPSEFEDVSAILDARYDQWVYGLPDDWTSSALANLEAVDFDHARRAFAETVKLEQAVWLIVGDKASLWEGLVERGFDVVEIDADGHPVAAAPAK